MDKKYILTKYACYVNNISLAVVANLSPLLFMTFRRLYGISFSLLGLLVLVNFVTQLTVDLLLSFFSHRINVTAIVRSMPLVSMIGIAVYSVPSLILPSLAYPSIFVGTIIFSAAAGMAEVLTSPVIAAIPAENPDREMSKLHSVYAWAIVGVVIVSTLFLYFVGDNKWQYLALLMMVIPLAATVMFARATLPPMSMSGKVAKATGCLRNKQVMLCVLAIFLSGASECTMAQWSSGYIESALGLPKIYGDIFGVAMFGIMMGVARSWYSKKGKNVYPVLFFGFAGAIVCYVVAALSGNAIVGLIACMLTGFCTGMLWPGSLMMLADLVPTAGVAAYALMASGGDLGAALAPQLVGLIADGASVSARLTEYATSIGLTPDQLGMRIGILVTALFSVVGAVLVAGMWRGRKKGKDL